MRKTTQVNKIPFVLILSFALVSFAYAQRTDERFRYHETIEKEFDSSESQTLILETDMGSIQITGNSGNKVEIKVTKGANRVSEQRAEEMFERFAVNFRQTNDGVEIFGEYDRPGFWRSSYWNKLKVIYEIQVPKTFNLEIVTSGGSMDVEQITGQIRLKTSGGSLKLRDLSGPVEAKTSGGSITASEVSGKNVFLRTSGGSIRVSDSGGDIQCKTSGGTITADGISGRLDAHTSGGGIRLNNIAGEVLASTSGGSIKTELVGQPEGPVALKTSGGSVTLYMDDNVKADIDASTSGGRVSVDFPVTVSGRFSRNSLKGVVNGGGPLITLRTSGGGIKLIRR